MNQLLSALNFFQVFGKLNFIGKNRFILNIQSLQFLVSEMRLDVAQIATVNFSDRFIVKIVSFLTPDDEFVNQRQMHQKLITKLDNESDKAVTYFRP